MTLDDELLERVVAGDALAWHQLWRRMEPLVDRVCRSPRIVGPLARREDERRNIELAIIAGLREKSFRRLRAYLDARKAGRAGSFGAWLTTVARRVALDAVRAHPEHLDPRGRRGGDRWARFTPNWSEHGVSTPGRTETLVRAAQLMDAARASCSPEQLDVLHRWLAGASRAEIAAELRVPSELVHRRLRSALKRLRDRYGKDAVAEQEAP